LKIHFGKLKPGETRAALASNCEGWCRTIKISGNIVEKRQKPTLLKDYGPFQIPFPMKEYIQMKYGVQDLNRLEAKNYARFFANVPQSLRECFPRVLGVEGGRTTVLKMEAVKDFDGKRSRPLSDFAGVSDLFFWKKFEEIVRYLKDNNITLLDLNAWNILVKRVSETESIPVIVDYKRMSGRMYPFQPDTWSSEGAMKKMLRKEERIRREYAP
jgi:hypothetical protein